MPNPNYSNLPWMNKQKEKVEAVKNSEKIEHIPVELIDYNEDNSTYNSNDKIDEIKELAGRISIEGLLFPIIIKKNKETSGRFILLSGERRLRAIRDILKRRTIPAIIKEPKSHLEEILIKNDTNLLNRDNTPEMKYKGYCEILDAIEKDGGDTSTLSLAEKRELTNLSKKRIEKYETMYKLEKEAESRGEELSFSSLNAIANEKRRVNAQQRRINEAIELFAQSRENVNSTVYADDDNLIYYVTEGLDNKFVVKMRDFTTNMPGVISKTKELPPSDSKVVMQTFLDGYANVYGLRIIQEEELLAQIKDNQNDKKQKGDEKEREEFPPIAISKEMVIEDLDEQSNSDSKDSDDDKKETIVDSKPQQIKNKSSEKTDGSRSDKQELEESENDETATNNKELEGQINLIDEVEFDSINPIDYLCEGRTVENGEIIRGYLVTNGTNFYIVKGKVSIEKPTNNNGATYYSTHCFCVEVVSDSLHMIKKK